MDHLEAIVVLKKIIPKEFIDKIIPLIDKKCENHLGVALGVKRSVRNVRGYILDFKTPTNLFYWNYIKNMIQNSYVYYKAKFPHMASNKINQIDLLKYEPGGKYDVHTDHFSDTFRHLSVIINLNDDYEGGDLVFTDQKEKIIKTLKLDAGTIVFFPSNFLYPHGIQPITKGTRYSIVSWLQ